MSHVFISYSKKNHGYARKLADKLLELGFDVWIDDRIDYGEEWWERIVKSIEGCGAFVALMTPQSRSSKWVRREVLLADKLNKPIFPLLLNGGNWEIFVDRQFIDVEGGLPPPKSFYLRLASTVPRRNHRGKEVYAHPEPEAPAQENIGTAPLGALPLPPDLSAILPTPFEWCFISAGKVRLAPVDDWRGKAAGGEFEVDSFFLAKYPITNAQFQRFVDAVDGYDDPQWWNYSSAAGAWRASNPHAAWPSFDLTSSYPRVNVSWYESLAFCYWLNAHIESDYQIMLPTEAQWQFAAAGDTGYAYPWGNEFDSEKCNTRESGVRQLTRVTQYPEGASPFGVMDMSGNVCEWCLNGWEIDEVQGSSPRCLRGGSWSNMAADARVIFRDTLSPNSRFNYRGFRIAAVKK